MTWQRCCEVWYTHASNRGWCCWKQSNNTAETDRQLAGQTEKHRQDRQTQQQTDREKDRQTDKPQDGQTNQWTGWGAYRHINRQTYRTNRQRVLHIRLYLEEGYLGSDVSRQPLQLPVLPLCACVTCMNKTLSNDSIQILLKMLVNMSVLPVGFYVACIKMFTSFGMAAASPQSSC